MRKTLKRLSLVGIIFFIFAQESNASDPAFESFTERLEQIKATLPKDEQNEFFRAVALFAEQKLKDYTESKHLFLPTDVLRSILKQVDSPAERKELSQLNSCIRGLLNEATCWQDMTIEMDQVAFELYAQDPDRFPIMFSKVHLRIEKPFSNLLAEADPDADTILEKAATFLADSIVKVEIEPGNNNFSSKGLSYLAQFKNLKTLIARFSHLTDEDLATLLDLNLETLDLSFSNNVTSNTIEALKKKISTVIA